MPKKYKDIYDQLLKNSKITGECLESTYKPNPKGCPYFTHNNKLLRVSRASWEYHKGQIPKGLLICHHCDNPKCFKIQHLFLGTPADNMQDMVKKKRDNMFGRRKYSQELLKKAEGLRMSGMTYQEIADELGAKEAGISAYLNRKNIIKGPNNKKYRKYPMEFAIKVKQMKDQGMRSVDIQKQLSITETTLYGILKRYF